MKTWSDPHLRRDALKLGFLAAVLICGFSVFTLTPALSAPTLASVIAALLLSPILATLERRGFRRAPSILALFALTTVGLFIAGMTSFRVGIEEWDSLRTKLPEYWAIALNHCRDLETRLQAESAIFEHLSITDWLVGWGRSTGAWFVTHGTGLMTNLLAVAAISPILTFFLLHDGPVIRKRFLQMIPNRFFEPAYLIMHDIGEGISDYLRAKLIEAFLVGAMTTAGLWIVGAPYAVVLGIIAGVTNIIPYAGPFIGAVPGLLVVLFDPGTAHLAWWVAGVYTVANLVDLFFIFPVLVAKLVNLHPVLLLVAVAVGQRYYGLIGMLISIPIAASFKVIIQQIYYSIYERASTVASPVADAVSPASDSAPNYSNG